MNKRRFEILEFLTGYVEASSRQIARACGIKEVTISVTLLRAHRFGWLNRTYDRGTYFYSLSQKAWDFWDQCGGSFIKNNPYYRQDHKSPSSAPESP